jgi:nucleolar protein 53
MGKRVRGAKLRAKKRSTLAAEENLETSAKETETQQVTSKTNEDLFVLDTTAVLPSKKQQEKQLKKKRKYTNSTKEQAQIEKLVCQHSAEKLQELTKTTIAKRAKIKKAVDPTFDLWDDNDKLNPKTKSQTKNTSSTTTNPGIGPCMAGTKPEHKKTNFSTRALPAPKFRSIKIDVAESGQSYNPDKVEHKKVIENAVQVEKKRQAAEELRRAPISSGMSEETKAYLVGDSDTEESSSSESESEDEKNIMKKKEKMTRAQRNRQKRIRREQKEILYKKREKKIQKSFGEAKSISKQLRKEEVAQKVEKEMAKTLKEESERTKGKNLYQQLSNENPIHAPTYPVALSSEIENGSLRTLKPKGSLVTDRMASFLDRDMAPKKIQNRKKRVEGKRRRTKVKVRGKGFAESKHGGIMG